MKKVILIFGVLSLLVFIRPVQGLNANSINATTTIAVSQTHEVNSQSFVSEAFDGITQFYHYTGFANAHSGNLLMIFIGIAFIYLGIKFDYEPLLLIPIGIGVIIGNIPFVAGSAQDQ